MTELAKKLILEANENIKNAANCFELLYKELELIPELKQNVSLAFGELVKCIKHAALMQGDITGKELMPIEHLEKAALKSIHTDPETVN